MMNLKRCRFFFFVNILTFVVLIVVWQKSYEIFYAKPEIQALTDLEMFLKDWCRMRQARTDIRAVLGPCHDQIKWTYERSGVPTNASKSFISSWDLHPAGQFSRFFIRSVSSDGKLKTAGGDWWRILIYSPVASLRPAVLDLGNGTYEVVFLIVEPGIYHVNITLDYTLCDGFRDPPSDWFILGNSQGKMQPQGTLHGRAKDDYLLQPFEDGEKITMNIRFPTGRGLYLFNSLPKEMAKRYDFSCGMKCKLIWDGYGRWADETWKPYLKAKQKKSKNQSELLNNTNGSFFDTLWIYGDSQARRMHDEVLGMELCRTMFKRCKLSTNWVYRYTSEFPAQDDLDFNYTRITGDLKMVLERPEMTENSVLVLNLGLHYLQTTSFSNYVKLLRGVVDIFRAREREGRKTARMIWKTTTETSKHKDTDELLRSDFKRFFTNARVTMYNAYATSFMCEEGFEILDVHPLTASYPHGTGGPNIEYFKEHDIVHYKTHVTRPFEDVLAAWLMGNLPEELTFENYQFS